MIPFPNSRYNIIYADPPWKLNFGFNTRTPSSHYSVMDVEEIKQLPVRDITANPCILFLWATFPKLVEALEVIKAWGFEYKTLAFSWIKLNNDNKPSKGMGFYTRANCEVCLLATRGKARSLVKDFSISSVVISKRGKHSKKPNEIRTKIVQLLGDLPRIELFSRQKIFGWDTWGDQIQPIQQLEAFC